MDMEEIWYGYGMDMEHSEWTKSGNGNKVVRQQNAVSQAFPSC